MELKLFFGLCAVVCELVSAFVYWKDILRGNTKPHLYSHLIFAIVMSIGFLGILAGGGKAGAYAFIVSVTFEISVTLASLWWGTTDITRSDKVFLALALGAIIPWIITKDPLGSVILIACIDACAMIPTIRKTYNDPASESLQAWLLAMSRGVFQILALSAYSVTTMLYSVEIFSVEAILISVILIRGGLIMLRK